MQAGTKYTKENPKGLKIYSICIQKPLNFVLLVSFACTGIRPGWLKALNKLVVKEYGNWFSYIFIEPTNYLHNFLKFGCYALHN